MKEDGRYIVGFHRPSSKHADAAQLEKLREAGADKMRSTVETLLRELRETDIVAVTHAYLLADPNAKLAPAMRKSFRKAFAGIHTAGATVWEVSTDLWSSSPKQLIIMEREAVDFLNRSRWHETGGRPPRDWSDTAAEARMRALWHDMRLDTNEAAIAALKAEGIKNVSVSILSKRLGPSGRTRLKADSRHAKKPK